MNESSSPSHAPLFLVPDETEAPSPSPSSTRSPLRYVVLLAVVWVTAAAATLAVLDAPVATLVNTLDTAAR